MYTLKIIDGANKERIVIFGDYDVDGVSSTAILVKFLMEIGCLVSYRLPHRVHDGYGLKDYFFDELNKFPKYKLENKESYRVIERKHNYLRQDNFKYEPKKWIKFNDVQDNNFNPFIFFLIFFYFEISLCIY